MGNPAATAAVIALVVLAVSAGLFWLFLPLLTAPADPRDSDER